MNMRMAAGMAAERAAGRGAVVGRAVPGITSHCLMVALVSSQTVSASEARYQQHCAGCHGQQAEGTVQGPPLIHRGYAPKHHSDSAFRRAITQGVPQHHWNFGDMPAFPQLDAAAVESILGYLRAQQDAAGIR